MEAGQDVVEAPHVPSDHRQVGEPFLVDEGARVELPERSREDDASDLAATDYPYGELGLSQRARDLGGR